LSGWFQVDLGVLGQFVSGVREAEESLRAACSAMAADRGYQLGTDGLNEAANRFQQGWGRGLRELQEGMDAMSGTLERARAAYQQADEGAAAIAKALGAAL
jgi:uncharacterized protein YukE